jgi:hypothetical protein
MWRMTTDRGSLRCESPWISYVAMNSARDAAQLRSGNADIQRVTPKAAMSIARWVQTRPAGVPALRREIQMFRIEDSVGRSNDQDSRGSRRAVTAALVAVALVSGLSACSSDEESPLPATTPATSSSKASTAPSTTRPTATSSVAVPLSTPTQAPVTRSPEPSLPPVVTSSAAPVAAAVPMPPVVCMNLQDAQNLIQELGVFYSRSVDASGRDRSQILDSNWIVVGQSPGVGVPIGEGDAVLSAVKIGEPNPC